MLTLDIFCANDLVHPVQVGSADDIEVARLVIAEFSPPSESAHVRFAVITTEFKLSQSPSITTPTGRDLKSEFSDVAFEKQRAYVVTAANSDAAMSLVRRFAASAGIEMMVHRTVEIVSLLLQADVGNPTNLEAMFRVR